MLQRDLRKKAVPQFCFQGKHQPTVWVFLCMEENVTNLYDWATKNGQPRCSSGPNLPPAAASPLEPPKLPLAFLQVLACIQHATV